MRNKIAKRLKRQAVKQAGKRLHAVEGIYDDLKRDWKKAPHNKKPKPQIINNGNSANSKS